MSMVPIPEKDEDWHALRLRHIGASEVSILFDCAPDYMMGPFALWQVKAGRMPPREVLNQRARWGLLLERAIAAGAGEIAGWTVLPGMYASLDGLGATLDRIIDAPGKDDQGVSGPGVLELKNADWLIHKRAWGSEPPTHILLQLQAQLLASGYTWGAIAVLVGGNDLRIYRYRQRPKVQAEIAKRVAHFWRTVAEGKPPMPDGSDSAYEALMVLEPAVHEEPPVDLRTDNQVPLLCATYLRAAAEEKEAARRKSEARNALLQKLGAARYARLEGYKLSQTQIAAVPPRPAEPGEIIGGRKESRRIYVAEDGPDAE